MPALEEKDIKDWSLVKLREEYGDGLDRLQSIKEANDDSLANVSGGDADEVRNLLKTTNILGERIEEMKELEDGDEVLADGRERQTPEGVVPQPGGPAAAAQGKVKGGDGVTQDIGGLFTESDAWKEFSEEGRKEMEARFPLSSLWKGYKGIGEVPSRKALFDSADFPIEDDFRPDPVMELFQPNNIGPLMAQGSTSAPTIKYPVENIIATGAAAVGEGAPKPEAEINFTPTSEDVKKLAVWLPLTDEALDDIPFLRAYINSRLRLFVQNEEDRQLLVGDGVGNNLLGLMNRAGIDASSSYSLAGANPDQALIDEIFSASMRVRESFLPPDAFTLRSATWETIRLAKDADRNYLLGPPTEDANVRLWGLQGVLNENMPAIGAGNEPVLTGAFRAAAMVVRRSEITLAVADQHSTYFVENKLAIRAEERVGLAVFRPASFATVTSAA